MKTAIFTGSLLLALTSVPVMADDSARSDRIDERLDRMTRLNARAKLAATPEATLELLEFPGRRFRPNAGSGCSREPSAGPP